MKRLFSRSAWSLTLLAGFGLSAPGCATVSERVASWIPNPKRDCEIRYNLARLRETDGQLAKAREEYVAIFDKYPGETRVPHRLAVVCARMGDDAEAKKYFDIATQLEPHNAEIWTDYGYMLLESEKYQEAESVFNQALRMKPDHERALSNLALCYGYQERMDDSFAVFRRAGSDAEAHANIAYLYLQLGKPDLATRHYSRALTLDPSIKPAGHALMQLAELHRQGGAAKPADAVATAEEQRPANELPQLETTHPAQHTELASRPEEIREAAPNSKLDSEIPEIAAVADKQASVLPVDTSSDAQEKQSPAIEHAVNTRPRDDVAAGPAKSSAARQTSRMAKLCPDAHGEVLQLVIGLETEDQQQLKRAIHKLGQLGADASAALPALKATLQHADPYVRIHSALALWRIDPSTGEIVPVLVEALGGDDTAVSTFAVAALGEIGSHSSAVLPALNRALADQDGYRRLHIAEALGGSDQWKSQAGRVLADCLGDDDANIRWLACYSIADAQPSDPEVVQALIGSLKDEDPRVQAGAAWALERIGAASRPAIPQLKNLAQQSTDADVRAAAAQCLTAIDTGNR